MNQLKKSLGFVWLWCVCNTALATNYIPTSSDEQSSASESFAETLMRIFTLDVVPVIQLVGAGILIYFGVTTIMGTIQEYKVKREFSVLMEGVVVLAILFGVGAGVFYLFSFITEA